MKNGGIQQMKKKWQIANLLFNDNTNFDYSLVYTNDDGESVTLYDSDTFWDKIVYKYTSWCITSPSFYDTETNSIIYTADNINKAIIMFHKLYNIWKAEKLPGFVKLYEAMRANYNPIWNVDGVTGIISEDTHTGTSTDARTGDDTTTASGVDRTNVSGNDTHTLSGSDSILHSGTITNGKNVTLDQNIKSGSITNGTSGTDTTTNQVSTFDDVTNWKNKDKSAVGYGKTETETFNNVTDAHTYSDMDTQTNNNTDATTYGKVDTLAHGRQDSTTYGKSDKTTYNSSNTETRNLADKHIELNIRQGNIGVTKTQELLESQFDITNKDALIDYMIADFIHNNCII